MATRGRPRADGSIPWLAHWREENGRQRTKTFETESAALDWEKKMRQEKDDQVLGIRTKSRETTLAQWIKSWWALSFNDWTRHTREGYARVINKYLDPELGPIPLAQLTAGRIARMRDELIAGGESAGGVSYAMSVLSSCLGAALERDLIEANHCRNLKKPRTPGQRIRKLKWPPDPEGVELIRAEFLRYRAPNSGVWLALRSATIVSVLAYAGLRPEEMIALKLGAFDRETRLLIIEDVYALEYRPGDTKTHYQRVVELEDAPAADLELWIDVAGLDDPAGWLFPPLPGAEVDYFTHNNWAKRPWKRARDKVVREHPDHDRTLGRAMPRQLRSAYVSLLARAGYSDADIAEMSGHSVEVLRKHYMGALRRLRRMPRRSVAEQIALARKATGVEELARQAVIELRAKSNGSIELVAVKPAPR